MEFGHIQIFLIFVANDIFVNRIKYLLITFLGANLNNVRYFYEALHILRRNVFAVIQCVLKKRPRTK